jgi:hypothetical protein
MKNLLLSTSIACMPNALKTISYFGQRDRSTRFLASGFFIKQLQRDHALTIDDGT